MKVVHLIGTNFFGGPERQILNHAMRVCAEGIVPQICSFSENGKANALLDMAASEGIACKELGSRHPFHPGVVIELVRYLKSTQTEVLVAHGYKANIVGRLATWCCGMPLVAVSRGWTAESLRIKLYEFLDRIFLRLADGVIAVSEGQRQKVLACGVRSDMTRVIRNAIDLASYPAPAQKGIRDELNLPPDVVLVVTAGRLSPEKNHPGLVEAAKLVLARKQDVYFVVFGEGFLRSELERAVALAGIEDHFILPGFRANVRALMHDADIFVLPSHTEGLPNVVLEAFACRKPVVATTVGGTPEVVRHGENGFLVAAGDMAGLAEHILTLASDPELRRRMGERGHERVRSSFDFATQTEAYLQVYQSLLAPGKHSPGSSP